jgi:nucleoside-diphosphate-sugar epimerase
MRILVIGNGFIATSVVNKLESESHELLVFSRTPNERIKCQQILGDIFNFEEFFKVLDWKPEIVIHTAWITTPGVYRNDYSNFKYAEFTTNLAQCIAHSEVEHLIILGTCAEYGLQVGPSTAGVTKLSPSTLYAEQKVVALNSVRELLQRSDVRFTWARIFYPYGPNQDQKRLIPHLIHSLKNGEPVLLADTSSIHDWITTRDVASAISWAVSNELPTEIDVGTSIGFTNLELLGTLEKLLQTKSRLPGQEMHNLGQGEVFVAGKTSPLFTSGWSPTDSLITGLEWMLRS